MSGARHEAVRGAAASEPAGATDGTARGPAGATSAAGGAA